MREKISYPAMDDPISIRPATEADARRLAELSAVLGYPVEAADMAARLSRLLVCDDNAVLVAAASGLVVGWIHGADHELLETGRHCEILGLVVDANHRRGGAGRRLVAAIEAWAASRGIAQMAVRSNVVRLESHPFYERLGYSRVKTQHSYRKSIEPRATRT
ncbi:MAG TPA: GNAT family N-acetyltransferase [Vicinamibacterales bacterium]|nr:GNAT family N-acetyltransferase [Vicinamibacterales bacterium]